MIEVEVDDLDEAFDLAELDSFSNETVDFEIVDYDRKCVMIIPGGEVLDEDHNSL
jgi:hypothetical protein